MTVEENKDDVELEDIQEDDAGTDDTAVQIDLDNETDVEALRQYAKSKAEAEEKYRKQLATTVHQKEHFKKLASQKKEDKPDAKPNGDESSFISFMVRNKDLDSSDGEMAIQISKALNVPLDKVREHAIFKSHLAAKAAEAKEKASQLGASKGGFTNTNAPSPTASPDKHRQFFESKRNEIKSRSKK